MSAKKDLCGKKFGMLTAISESPERKGSFVQWLCKCDCGNDTIVAGAYLSAGRIQSCGCQRHGAYPGSRGEMMPADVRFWSKVDISGDCWTWCAGKYSSGYGMFNFNGKDIGAHRAAWIFTHGEIADGLFVLHKCDNPPCVNPEHLFLGTHQDNMTDKARKGRVKSTIGEYKKKLCADDVREIRRLRSQGELEPVIGAMFGITQCHVSKIALRQCWKGVE